MDCDWLGDAFLGRRLIEGVELMSDIKSGMGWEEMASGSQFKSVCDGKKKEVYPQGFCHVRCMHTMSCPVMFG